MPQTFPGLLELLERRVTAMGAPVASNLAPGLAPDVVRNRLAAHGLVPGQDLLDWFAWHNGVVDDRTANRGMRTLLDWQPLSLDQALEEWRRADKGAEPWQWNPAWLPIADQGARDRLAVECSEPPREASRVRSADPWTGMFDESLRPSVQGLQTLVTWWIDAIESGRWRYSLTEARWTYEVPTTYPTGRLATGLV